MRKVARRIFVACTICVSTALLLIPASGASAESCTEHALLRHEPSSKQYKWTNKVAAIRVWESPDMIRSVGIISLGSDVEVLERSRGFVKIKVTESGETAVGWVSERQVEHFSKTTSDGEQCDEETDGDATR